MDLCVSYQIILSNSWMLGSDFRFESMCKLLDHMIQLLATRKLNLEKDLLGRSQSLGDVSLNRDKCLWSTPSYSQIQQIFCYSVRDNEEKCISEGVFFLVQVSKRHKKDKQVFTFQSLTSLQEPSEKADTASQNRFKKGSYLPYCT